MIICPECGSTQNQDNYKFCRKCGGSLSQNNEQKTRPMKPRSGNNEKTIRLKTTPSLEEENKRLVAEIEKLRETSAHLFGKSEEDAGRRIHRILTVQGLKSDIMGSVKSSLYDSEEGEFYEIEKKVPGFLGNFKFYKRSLTHEGGEDQVVYVATYSRPVDFEKELADIRVLLAELSTRNIPCCFILGTNENLRSHRAVITRNFNRIKGFLSKAERAKYSLEILDCEAMIEKELELKIKTRSRQNKKTQAN